MQHVPVLLQPVLDMALGMERPVEDYLDGTFGRGGHYQALLEKFPEMNSIVVDQDPEAVEYAQKNFADRIEKGSLKVLHGNFHNFQQLKAGDPDLKDRLFDFILVDLGVSSPQLDDPERGFSFYHNGPLDMRMDTTAELKAEDIVNTWTEDALKDLFYNYGEIRRPGRVVSEVLEKRKDAPFTTTRQLASLIEKVEGWRKKGQHPATRYFLALRMEVNRELEPLEEAIEMLVQQLKDGGRLVVLTFHSLEDRIVKFKFKSLQHVGFPVNKKVIQATWDEKKSNSRARSAKLRAFQRGEKP